MLRQALRSLALALPLILAACGGPSLVTTIDGLSSDTDQEGAFKVDQNRVVSLMGNLMANVPGELVRFKNDRAPSTAYGLTAGNSYVDVLEIPGPEKAVEAVSQAREEIQKAQRAAARLVAAKLDLIIAKQELRRVRMGDDADAVTTAEEELSELRDTLDERRDEAEQAADKASQMVNKSGMVVFRWTTREQKGGSVLALFAAAFGAERETGGYTIAAGWRENVLVVGPDVANIAPPFGEVWDYFVMWKGWLPWIGQNVEGKYARIVTRTVQTQAVAFLQDEQSLMEIEASLEAAVEDLGSTEAALAAMDSVEIQLALKRAYHLTTEGILGNSERKRVTDVFEKKWGGELDADFDGWLTLMCVDANFNDLLDSVGVED